MPWYAEAKKRRPNLHHLGQDSFRTSVKSSRRAVIGRLYPSMGSGEEGTPFHENVVNGSACLHPFSGRAVQIAVSEATVLLDSQWEKSQQR